MLVSRDKAPFKLFSIVFAIFFALLFSSFSPKSLLINIVSIAKPSVVVSICASTIFASESEHAPAKVDRRLG